MASTSMRGFGTGHLPVGIPIAHLPQSLRNLMASCVYFASSLPVPLASRLCRFCPLLVDSRSICFASIAAVCKPERCFATCPVPYCSVGPERLLRGSRSVGSVAWVFSGASASHFRWRCAAVRPRVTSVAVCSGASASHFGGVLAVRPRVILMASGSGTSASHFGGV